MSKSLYVALPVLLCAALSYPSFAVSKKADDALIGDEGTTYAEVVDDIRKQLADRYLKERALTVSEIACETSGSENDFSIVSTPSAKAFLNTSAVGHATSRNT